MGCFLLLQGYVEATLRNHQLVRGNSQQIIKALTRGKERVMGETVRDAELNSMDAFAMGNEVIKIILAVLGDYFVRTQGRSKHVPTKVVPTAKLLAWLEEKGEAAAEKIRQEYPQADRTASGLVRPSGRWIPHAPSPPDPEPLIGSPSPDQGQP